MKSERIHEIQPSCQFSLKPVISSYCSKFCTELVLGTYNSNYSAFKYIMEPWAWLVIASPKFCHLENWVIVQANEENDYKPCKLGKYFQSHQQSSSHSQALGRFDHNSCGLSQSILSSFFWALILFHSYTHWCISSNESSLTSMPMLVLVFPKSRINGDNQILSVPRNSALSYLKIVQTQSMVRLLVPNSRSDIYTWDP